MTQNKTTPLSEKAVSIGDIDFEDDSVSKRFFRKEDVKEAVRRLIDFIIKSEEFDGYKAGVLDFKLEEIFGKELCEEEKQDE